MQSFYWQSFLPTGNAFCPHAERLFYAVQDELLSTELVFSGLLADLSPPEAVALISALVFQVIDSKDVALEMLPGCRFAGLRFIPT